MSSNDKDGKSLKELCKKIFGFGKSGIVSVSSRRDFAITPELEIELSNKSATLQRLEVIKDLSKNVYSNRLENQEAVEKLWLCTKDLLHVDQPSEVRHTMLVFLHSLISGQYELLTLMRSQFFRLVTEYDHPDDTKYRLEILQALTDNGKDIKYLEEDIGKFMLLWMPTITNSDLMQNFLSILVNLIKFNAAYLYIDVISKFVNNTCSLCCSSDSPEVVDGCLQVLEVVVCYSVFPHECLQTFIFALCRTVNVEKYCQTSWKIMRSFLGTDSGHSALRLMCVALASGGTDCALVRGAVFYLNMALWGSNRVKALKCTPIQVLPSFLKALEGNQSVVTYEVILALQSLVNKHGQELHEPAWDLIFNIILTILNQLAATQRPFPETVLHLHETITCIEQLHDSGNFNGNVENMYSLIDACGHSRPEKSVRKLISYLASCVVPTNHDWILTLNRLVERYGRKESRVSIRLSVLQTLQLIVEQNRSCYEDELLDSVVLPNLQQCSTEADPTIRCASAKLLIELGLHCHSKKFSDIFDILEKLLNRPFELYVTNEAISLSSSTDISDILAVASGMVKVFLDKLHRLPSSHALQVYLAALHHLELHYEKPSRFENHPTVRLTLLEWLLSARANSFYHVGFPSKPGERVLYSPYLCVESVEGSRPSHSPTPQPHNTQSQVEHVSIQRAYQIIVLCLKEEKDWAVLQLVLREIPNVMQNKALVLSKKSNDIDLLASALCSMVADKSMKLPESLRNTTGKITRSDFHAFVLPVLTCLAPYHTHLDSLLQQRIIKCITKFGLVSHCAQQCVTALTIFTLEMRDTMVKLLPDVLLDLSKISDTIYIAVPILEFLSTITRLPKVFASFVGDQYMSVFAILLPYTNPFKYNHYIVSLAHHVIAAWFLKCRLPFRRDFVSFIKRGLRNYVLKPFEEGKLKQDFIELNQDSSNRKRSASLTEQGSRRREVPSRPALGELNVLHKASNTFHIELTETCLDLMARYTYSPSISAPKRLHTSEFLFSGGQTMMWLVGQKIITITTSGCAQNALRQGLCDRCLTLCKAHTDSLPSPFSTVGTGGSGASGTLTAGSESDRGSSEGLLQTVAADIKRYTKYTLQHSKSNETTYSSSSISDNVLYPPSGYNTLSLQSLSGHTTRQNSSENKNEVPTGSPKGNMESAQPGQLSLKLESLANKQSSEEKSYLGGSLPPRISGAGGPETRHCGCWCGGWAEVHVRGPTGDVSWVMRIQNQANLDSVWSDYPLSDTSSLFLGGGGPSPAGVPGGLPYHLGSAASIASSGFQDARSDMLSDGDPRSRSGSGGSQPEQIQKSSSDSVVGPGPISTAPHASSHCIVAQPPPLRTHISTGPINIPGSPQRQNSSGTNMDDEEGLYYPNDPTQDFQDENKSRHPVRRSNSSPEMSSSWKNPSHVRERMDTKEAASKEAAECGDMLAITNNGNMDQPYDTSTHKGTEENNSSLGSSLMQGKKGHTMKSLTKDMRVSCEAIPEEISGSTPPHPTLPQHAHPHLLTYNSDPGAVLEKTELLQVSSTSSSVSNLAKVSFENLDHPPGRSDSIQETYSKVNKPADIIIVNSTKATSFTGDTITKAPMSQDLLKLSAKPPHSPAPASPRPINRIQNFPTTSRMGQPQMSQGRSNSLLPSDTLRSAANFNLKFNEMHSNQPGGMIADDLPPVSRSKRSNTISVMSPTRRSPTRRKIDNQSPKSKDSESKSRWGASPAFVFLQLYHGSGAGGSERPLLLSADHHTRSVKTLDHVPPLETYRVGVLYVGRGQHDNETKILKNEFGSLRYAEFLQDLGTLISLEDAESMGLFLNVEKGGRDGRFAYVWQDDIMQVQFHVATLMPNNPSDPECNEKRKHIGNDFVSIVYNESGEDFNIQTIKGHFNFACVIIEPLDHGTNKVTIKTKDELIEKEFLNTKESKIISNQNVALLARQLALHANLASLISQSLSTKSAVPMPYASNWLERLRIIKRLRNKLVQEREARENSSSHSQVSPSTPGDPCNRLCMEDFTEYT